MSIVFTVLGTGILLGFALGGSVRNLAKLHLRHAATVALILLACRLLLIAGLGSVATVLSVLVLLAFMILNRTVPGIIAVSVGIAANSIVTGITGSMPVILWGSSAHGGGAVLDGLHVAIPSQATLLSLFADVVPVPRPLNVVVSLGDILMFIGVIVLIATSMAAVGEDSGDTGGLGSEGSS